MSKKQKSCLIRSDLSENMSLLLQNSFLAITMSISQKSVQKRRLGEKYGFFFNEIESNHGFIVPFAVRRLNCRIPYKL